jgi:putative Mg2+ transporter-C (MgtC) family protein
MHYLPPLDINLTMVAKLLLAAGLGGAIGLERELQGKPAGLRTNMFICLGCALFTILSTELASTFGGDPTRVASQLIPGIGFIGAGSIIQARGAVHGLTTAATIFVLASIGMAAGAGRYATALFVSLVILVGLWILGWLEKHFALKKELRRYRVCGRELGGTTTAVLEIVNSQGLILHRLSTAQAGEQFRLTFELDSSSEQHTEIVRLLSERNLACEVSTTGLSEG